MTKKSAVACLLTGLCLMTACKWINPNHDAGSAPTEVAPPGGASLTDPAPGQGAAGDTPATVEAFMALLQGRWNQSCAQAAGAASYMTSRLKVDGQQAVLNETEFSDSQCLHVATPQQTTPLQITVTSLSQNLPGGFDVDVTLAPGEIVYVTWMIKGGTFYPADTSDAQYDGTTADKRTRSVDEARPYARL